MEQGIKEFQKDLMQFVRKSVQTKSFSDQEGEFARLLLREMEVLGYDEMFIDSVGNAVGRVGDGETVLHFDGHMDTVLVNDGPEWQVPPFSGEIVDGSVWGRGSVDMKSGLCAAVYAAAWAKRRGYLHGKTVYVTGTVCEEYCDGENLKHLYQELGLKPHFCVICEPSDNVIMLGHKGKAQIRIITHGISAHGSAPDKGKNAVYGMAEIIRRVEQLNRELSESGADHGTIVLSDISCVSASFNAVPSRCTIYLDRRLTWGETLDQVRAEMDQLVEGNDAKWEAGTLHHTSWNGGRLDYEPLHEPWKLPEDSGLALALKRAWAAVYGREAGPCGCWDFGTNAVTPVSMGVPTIGFGPGEYKLAHMRDEHCAVKKIEEAFMVYGELIREL